MANDTRLGPDDTTTEDHPENCWCYPRCEVALTPGDLYWLEKEDYDPPSRLKALARQHPEIEWLCYLPPSERAWYTGPERGAWVRQWLLGHIADWGWEALQRAE